MTTLQIILAAVGVLFIALIVGYNLWQERRYRKEASRMFSNRREDILLGESVRSGLAHVSTESGQGYRSTQEDALESPPSWQEEVMSGVATEPADTEQEADRPVSQPLGYDAAGETMDLGSFRAERPQAAPSAPASAPAEAEKHQPPVSESGREAVPWEVASPEPAPVPKMVAPQPAQPAVETATHRFEAESPLDQEIEYVARLRFTKPVFVSYNALMDKLRKVGKAVRAMGRRADGGWDRLAAHPPTAYESLEFGVLLADRNGALAAEQMEQFCRALYDFAAEEGGAVSCPDRRAAQEKARDLDLFCVDVDVLIGLNVVARDARPFSGVEIDRVVSGAGLKLGMDGTYVLEDDDGLALFTIANQEEQPFRTGGVGVDTHGLSLIFDLPRVRDGINVFDRMTTLGRQLADNLGGRLVDDNGRLVTQDSLQKDRKRLNDYFARMQARGIPAGGERALRLFA